MPIPDFQSIMLPLLKILADGKIYKYREILEDLVREFQVREAERKEMLPSGQQEIFANRVGWAKTYLKKAGLIESPQRATFVISERGISGTRSQKRYFHYHFLFYPRCFRICPQK
jgi:restriction system protein